MREAEARYNLAMMMLHNGDADRARTELERCLKADPTSARRRRSWRAWRPARGTRPRRPRTVKAGWVTDVQPVGYEELAPVKLNSGR